MNDYLVRRKALARVRRDYRPGDRMINRRSFLGMLAALKFGIKVATDKQRLSGRDLDSIAFDEMDDWDRASLAPVDDFEFLTVGVDEIPVPHLPHAAKIGDTIAIRKPQRYRRTGNA